MAGIKRENKELKREKVTKLGKDRDRGVSWVEVRQVGAKISLSEIKIWMLHRVRPV